MTYDPARAFRNRMRLTESRIKDMGMLIARWDEYDAIQLLPPEARNRNITKPRRSRADARWHQDMLVQHLGELEELWERRQ